MKNSTVNLKDPKQRKPTSSKSRKALEYRVFWLERKLSFLKESEKRNLSADRIASMPTSPIKELMHLNNEFQRANDKAHALKNLTEELNQDALRINERSERMNEITVGKITDAERLNRQTRRLHEKNRKVNNHLQKTSASTKETNRKTDEINTTSAALIEESKYLSKLSRAQHLATDRLNQKTRSLNVDALKSTAASIQLNRETSATHKESQSLNQQIRSLKEELEKTKSELNELADKSTAINTKGASQLKEMLRTKQFTEDITEQCQRNNTDVASQLAQTKEINKYSKALNKQSESNTEQFSKLTGQIETHIKQNQNQHETIRENAKRDITQLELDAVSNLKGFTDYHGDIIKVELRDSIEKANAKLKKSLETSESEALNLKIESETIIEKNMKDSEAILTKNIKDSEAILTKNIKDAAFVREELKRNGKQIMNGFIEKNTKITNDILEDIKGKFDTSLKKSETIADMLATRMNKNLSQSQDFFDETIALNDTTERIVKEGLELNVESIDLHDQCHRAIDEITHALDEIDRLKSKIDDDTRDLQCQSEELNAESKLLIKTGTDINKQSLEMQKESVNTQSLSQEINDHSLALHQEIRVINQDFDQINETNRTLVERLISLKSQLQTLYKEKQSQIDEVTQTTLEGKALNHGTTKLNAEAQILNDEMIVTLGKTKTTLAESENINQNSLNLSKDVKASINQLEFVRDDVAQASSDSRLAAAEARQIIEETMAIHADLIDSADEMKCLSTQTSEELTALGILKKESTEVANNSRDAYLQLKGCISQSRQINDDFMRGLEATTKAHKQTEQNAQEILTESKELQTDIRDMLSLKTGVKEFQHNIDECQTNLIRMETELSHCKQTTSTHSGLLSDYQSKIEEYQSDLNRYRGTVDQFELRSRKFASQFVDQDVRIKNIESHQEKTHQDILDRQLEQGYDLEREIKATIQSNKLTLNEDLSKLKSSMTNSLDLLVDEIKAQVNLELDQKQKKQNEKIQYNSELVNDLNSEFHQLNQNISNEISLLREESNEMRNKNREFLQEQRISQREASNNIEHNRHGIDEVNHKLGNYRTLLEDKIDDQENDLLKARLNNLEVNIRTQQSSAPNKQTVEALSTTVDELSHSLGAIAESNRSLKMDMAESEKRNKLLTKYNNQLKSSVQKGEDNLQNYADRLGSLEHSISQQEAKYQETIGTLNSNENQTKQTLQQMRLAMKDSTKAMRETQKTLQSFKPIVHRNSTQKSSDEKPKKSNWIENSKQAVLSSFVAVFLTSLAFMGYEDVDASTTSSFDTVLGKNITLAESPLLIPKANKIHTLTKNPKDFSWPVNFSRLDTQSIHYVPHHKGISISAELGDPVIAANDGVVIYSAKEIRGYGNVIVIQHDNELVSVYANNQFNYVNEGDTVKQGQLIGDIGQLFNQEKAGLYFEIRYMGNPEDPFNYLSHNIQPELISMR